MVGYGSYSAWARAVLRPYVRVGTGGAGTLWRTFGVERHMLRPANRLALETTLTGDTTFSHLILRLGF